MATTDALQHYDRGTPSGDPLLLAETEARPRSATRVSHSLPPGEISADGYAQSRRAGLQTPPAPETQPTAAQYRSTLFPEPPASHPNSYHTPPFFGDLNLDQIIDAVIAGREDYNLRSFFLYPLSDAATVEYRHEVLRDLENLDLLDKLRTFATAMRTMREHLQTSEKLHYQLQKEAWFLDAAAIYCRSVRRLTNDLGSLDLASRGLRLFLAYLQDYITSHAFLSLEADNAGLQDALSQIQYCFLINGDLIEVRRYEGEPDETAEVTRTFAKFQQRSAKSYLVEFPDFADMNHIEAAILGRVARLYPTVFADLADYRERYGTYRDEKVAAFDREIQFYIAYLEYIAPLRQAGLRFCRPEVTRRSKAVQAGDTFDLALAKQLQASGKSVVVNDFHLHDRERILVVSGPNQGGKTTFARTFGQLHYLASLGLPVPGRNARLFLFDRLFTHFERQENVHDLRGKLEDDLRRIHEIVVRATPDSVIILNEIFTSTTLEDALFLSEAILERIIALDALCVCVTFIDELASLADQIVSMVSTVDPGNPALRTYKVERRPADGLAYAMTVAEKYRLTYTSLRERVRQ